MTNLRLQNATLSNASSSRVESPTSSSASPCNCEFTSELEKKRLHLREMELQNAKTQAENDRFKLKMEFIKLCVEKEITEEDVQKYDNMANSLFG